MLSLIQGEVCGPPIITIHVYTIHRPLQLCLHCSWQ